MFIRRKQHLKTVLPTAVLVFTVFPESAYAAAWGSGEIGSVFDILKDMTNIYISKKRKEVIIMRINGFSYRDTIIYLIRETILTTILGILFGIVLGYFLAPVLISFCQSADNQFITAFNFKAWAFAVGIEILFAFIVNLIAYRRIRTFNMREITAS